jgi:hypothetical protein
VLTPMFTPMLCAIGSQSVWLVKIWRRRRRSQAARKVFYHEPLSVITRSMQMPEDSVLVHTHLARVEIQSNQLTPATPRDKGRHSYPYEFPSHRRSVERAIKAATSAGTHPGKRWAGRRWGRSSVG